MEGTNGYLSVVDWPLLPFYGLMCGLYVAMGLGWLVVCKKIFFELFINFFFQKICEIKICLNFLSFRRFTLERFAKNPILDWSCHIFGNA